MLATLFLVSLIKLAESEPIKTGSGGRREIALTFDACQDAKPAGYDGKIIQILTESKTKATLFLGGAWSESHRFQAKALGRNSLFEIAQHSYLHPHYPRLTAKQTLDDLSRAQTAITEIAGHAPKFVRPPYGEFDSNTLVAAKSLGLKTVRWSLVTGDPDKHVTAKAMEEAVRRQAKPGAIVIMHMNGRGWHTAEALPSIIRGLRAEGYEFVTLSELLRP